MPAQPKKESSDKVFYILMAIVALIIIGLIIFVASISNELDEEVNDTDQTAQDVKPTKEEITPTPTATIVPSPTPVKKGSIQGSLGYSPNNSLLPEAIKEVCAINTESRERICTSDFINNPQSYRYGYGYKIEVPEGTYNVISVVDTEKIGLDRDDFYGLFSQLTRCEAYRQDFGACEASKYACEAVDVEVVGEQNKFNVNPWDFYTRQQLPDKAKCQP